MMNTLVAAIATLAVAGGMFAQTTISRLEIDPHYRFGRDPGCAELANYADDLNTIFTDHESFANFMFSGDTDALVAMDETEVQDLVDDGDAMLVELDDLEPPAVYDNGQRGVRLLVTSSQDLIYFYTVDTTAPIEVYDFDKAVEYIYGSERSAADLCADEVDAMGGYVFTEPPPAGE